MSARAVVAVTGANGEIGAAVCARLSAAGYHVRGVDVDRRGDADAYVRADLVDPWGARLAVEGADAVVHLAAIGNCDHDDDWCAFRHERLIRNNVMSTYNLFEARTRCPRDTPVVWASSETVVGPPFDERNVPDYLPVDARHPRRPSSPYGLSKLLCEEVAEFFWRVHDIPSIGLRLSVVRAAGRPAYSELAEGLWNLWGYVPLEDVVDAIVSSIGRTGVRGALFEHVVGATPASDVDVAELRRRFLSRVPVRKGVDESFWRAD